MKPRHETPELVQLCHQLFEYRDGRLYRKVTVGRGKAGELAARMEFNGYMVVKIRKRRYKEHRLIYMMHYGECPDVLDHINRIRHDNRLENLRGCTKGENGINSKVRSDNSSGIRGVCFAKRQKKWVARIYYQGKQVWLGSFDSKEEAQAAYEAKRTLLYGEFA